jgi:uncharacterized protein YuzB (UPF0349 family)
VRPASSVAVIPDGILATKANRLEVETAGRTSAAAYKANIIGSGQTAGGFGLSGASLATATRLTRTLDVRVEPIPEEQRKKALQAVDQDLVKAGIIDRVGGDVSPKLQAELGFERTTCLPTQAIMVKGCLDDCNVCETSLQKSIELDLVHKDLENQLLERQIALLEKSQEYRCCPAGEKEEDEDGDA